MFSWGGDSGGHRNGCDPGWARKLLSCGAAVKVAETLLNTDLRQERERCGRFMQAGR